MSDYGSCLLSGYGVLPGAPLRVKAPLIASHFAIIEWSAPKILPETVTTYHVHIRKLGVDEKYNVIEKDHPPFILESLDSGTYYEAFLVALNAHGKGAPSSRLIFQTKREVFLFIKICITTGNFLSVHRTYVITVSIHFKSDDLVKAATSSYNITACCTSANLLPQCMPLCTYDQRISDLQLLGQACSMQMAVLSKCAAGGRDHSSCCTRRGVPNKCLSLCRGIVPQPAVNCLPFGGNIIQCFEEGMPLLCSCRFFFVFVLFIPYILHSAHLLSPFFITLL